MADLDDLASVTKLTVQTSTSAAGALVSPDAAVITRRMTAPVYWVVVSCAAVLDGSSSCEPSEAACIKVT